MTDTTIHAIDTYLHARDVPELDRDGVVVERFEISEDAASFAQLRAQINGRRTRIVAGTYTKLVVDGLLWMSDTPDECDDHRCVLHAVRWCNAERVLVHGLGLGVVINALLHEPTVEHIDVVECDRRVVDTIGSHYRHIARRHGVDLVVHRGDALTYTWPKGTRWDVVWHDIWPTISADNLREAERLHRRFGRRCTWQKSWSVDRLLEMAVR